MAVIIIPAAGLGSRFSEAGYEDPKPLIKARGVPMIRRVVNMFNERTIVVCQKQYERRIRDVTAVETIPITKLTEGAALSVLCAEALVNDEDPVVVVNSDNIIADGVRVLGRFLEESAGDDGAIVTFEVSGGPWSYARVRGDGRVVQVAEKTPISNLATAGIYYFKSWRILRTAVCRMVAANDRYNGEFYLAPAYNYMIGAGMTVSNFTIPAKDFIGLGTPAELEAYNGSDR